MARRLTFVMPSRAAILRMSRTEQARLSMRILIDLGLRDQNGDPVRAEEVTA